MAKAKQERAIKKKLINELKAGEKSGFVTGFDRKKHLAKLHVKYKS